MQSPGSWRSSSVQQACCTAPTAAHPGVVHSEAPAGGGDAACVGRLPALLCVEGRALQHQAHLRAHRSTEPHRQHFAARLWMTLPLLSSIEPARAAPQARNSPMPAKAAVRWRPLQAQLVARQASAVSVLPGTPHQRLQRNPQSRAASGWHAAWSALSKVSTCMRKLQLL